MDKDLFLESLNNLSNNFSESKYSVLPGGMIDHERYNIAFHSRFPSNELKNSDGLYAEKFQENLDELKSRINHLAQKTDKIFKTNRRVLFIIKLKI